MSLFKDAYLVSSAAAAVGIKITNAYLLLLGEPKSKSLPEEFLGKAITCLIDLALHSIAINLSSPKAMPP